MNKRLFFVYLFHAIGGQFYGIGGSRDFAYFFLDYSKVGISGVVDWMICITICEIIMGCVWLVIYKVIKKKH